MSRAGSVTVSTSSAPTATHSEIDGQETPPIDSFDNHSSDAPCDWPARRVGRAQDVARQVAGDAQGCRWARHGGTGAPTSAGTPAARTTSGCCSKSAGIWRAPKPPGGELPTRRISKSQHSHATRSAQPTTDDTSENALSGTCGGFETPGRGGSWPSARADSRDVSFPVSEIAPPSPERGSRRADVRRPSLSTVKGKFQRPLGMHRARLPVEVPG
jgi:hypothetical protein